MRYPIFKFDGDDLHVYNTPEEHWHSLEAYDVDYPDIILDSDGRLLQKSDAGNDRVKISDSRANSDPERLRSMLIHALRARGQQWSDDAALEDLIPAAQAAYGMDAVPNPIIELFSKLARLLRVRGGTS